MKHTIAFPLLTLVAVFLLPGCFTIKTQHEVKPIHITVDVNLRIQKELDDLFGDLDAASATLSIPESK